MVKNSELSNNMRPYDRLRVKGRNEHLDVYMFVWEEEEDMTNMATDSSGTNPARYDQATKLTLTFKDSAYVIPADTTSYILGRGKDCELVIDGDLISRHHSKIEHRRGKFILSDQSTNGTFLRTTEGQDIFLRREEFTELGSGSVSLGKKVDPVDPNAIHFICA